MEFTAKQKNIRITPRKLGLIADAVRGKKVNEALLYLKFSPRRRTADTLASLIKAAVSYADQKGTVDVDQLMIKTLLVSKGPTLKRFMPRAKGSASRILKYTSHLVVTVQEK